MKMIAARTGKAAYALMLAITLAAFGAGQTAQAQSGHPLLGGPRGVVRLTSGEPLEGVMVQLIAQTTAIRTTVYSNDSGQYEFPKLEAGTYTLRIAKPLEHKPYVRESIQISGAAQLPPIVLERVTEDELLPPTPEIAAQLSGAEWLMNLPGTGREKRIFNWSCGGGCHSWQQIFRTRFDEQGWDLMVERMTQYAGSPLINRRPSSRGNNEEQQALARWLARVRGPGSKDEPYVVLPPARGAGTRVIVTEYELPRTLLAPHDVHGDSKGNIWYTPHRSPYVGKLDPRTGKVTEYRVPTTQGALPGTHRVWVDQNDIVWASENWAHNLNRLDPATGEWKQFHIETGIPVNSPGFSNFAMDEQGFVYETLFDAVVKIDSRNGQIVARYPFERISSTYDNIVSNDGRYWAGGQSGTNLIGVLDLQSGRMEEIETQSVISGPARGAFDREGNAWLGGRGGRILKINPQTKKITEYSPPIPYVAFYEAHPDKNGEVWAGALHGGRFLRLNPRTEAWTTYVLPEPFSHNRRTWIDNSTTPVTVWYVDHNGWMVRIQPLE
jgi:streptogramin lyase